MKDLELLIQKLKFFKKNRYQDLINDVYNRSNLVFFLKTNPIIKDYIENITKKISNYSEFKKFDISRKALPICILYSSCMKRNPSIANSTGTHFDTILWNNEGLDGILRVLRVILKEHKKIKNLQP